MIFTAIVRILCFSLVYTSFTPLQAVHIANDPYEVDYSSEGGQRVKTLLEILGRKNHHEIKEMLQNTSFIELVNTIAVSFCSMGKITSRLPLLQAVIDGDHQIIEMLLNAGADPLCKAPNYLDITPLHIVASYNSEQQRFMHTCPKIDTTISPENARTILDLFLAKIPKSHIDTLCGGQEPMTPLFYAAVWGNDYEVTKKLVQAGAKVFTKHTTAGLLPKRAIIQGNLACFQALYDTWHELNPHDRSRDEEWKSLSELAEKKQTELAIKNLFKPKTKKTYPS